GKIGTPLIRNHKREMRTATTENPAPCVSKAGHGPWAKRGAPHALQNRAGMRIGAPHRGHGGGVGIIGTSKAQTIAPYSIYLVISAVRSRVPGEIVFRTRTPLVPSEATLRKPSPRNIPSVPNQRHSGTAAIFAETTGSASPIPPPCSLIDSSAALSAYLATPRPRYLGSTKKQVILHSFTSPTGGAALR